MNGGEAAVRSRQDTHGGAGGAAISQRVLWGLLLLYLCARILQLYSGIVPILIVVILHVVPAALFALLHGAGAYRLKGALAFFGLSMGVGSVFELLSLRTGFPFGHYHFTAVMGPKLFGLPFLLALAYVGMGYTAWMLAVLIVSRADEPISGARLVTLPLIASFVMVAWDLSMEPVWATVDRAWVWRDGGSYFGVPVSNFFGWCLTSYVYYQLFALYLRGRRALPERWSYWRLPIFIYTISAGGNLLLAIPTASAIRMASIVYDGGGRQWRVSDIIGVCVVISVFVMLPIALMAWVRLMEPQRTSASYRLK